MKTNNTVDIINRKAKHEYLFILTIEAGIILQGTEIKSIREGRANISESFARPESGELWLFNAHISQHSAGGIQNYEPTRPRKLLLHKNQIIRLSRQVSEKRLTLIPLRIYLKRHLAKVELGLAKGRRQYDKRHAIREKERVRDARDALRR